MNEKILINMPNFWAEYKPTLAIIDLHNKYPNIFKENLVFNSVYDCFPSIWAGGRSTIRGWVPTKEKIENKLIPFLERGIQIRYNFTNLLLEEKHLYEKNSNLLLDLTMDLLKKYNTNLGITISSPLLKAYLEKRYPSLYFIWSTTLGKIGIDKINKLSTNDLLVLDYNYNNDFEFLKNLKNPQNIEILINEHCIPNCPYRDTHWRLVSEAQLAPNANISTGCLNSVMKTAYGHSIHEKVVSIEQMKENYLPLNINKIKLAGRREYEKGLIGQYSDIFILEEYRQQVFDYLADNYLMK